VRPYLYDCLVRPRVRHVFLLPPQPFPIVFVDCEHVRLDIPIDDEASPSEAGLNDLAPVESKGIVEHLVHYLKAKNQGYFTDDDVKKYEIEDVQEVPEFVETLEELLKRTRKMGDDVGCLRLSIMYSTPDR